MEVAASVAVDWQGLSLSLQPSLLHLPLHFCPRRTQKAGNPTLTEMHHMGDDCSVVIQTVHHTGGLPWFLHCHAAFIQRCQCRKDASDGTKSASAGNRARITMAAMYSTTRPLMLLLQPGGSFCWASSSCLVGLLVAGHECARPWIHCCPSRERRGRHSQLQALKTSVMKLSSAPG